MAALTQQIARMRAELRSEPQARRRMALRERLRIIEKVRQLRREIRADRKAS